MSTPVEVDSTPGSPPAEEGPPEQRGATPASQPAQSSAVPASQPAQLSAVPASQPTEQGPPAQGDAAPASQPAERGPAPPPSCMRNFCLFLYNSKRGTCMSRTAKSWLHIIICYIIFFGFLALKLLVVLKVFHMTIDPQTPKHLGTHSLLSGRPGLVAYREDPTDSSSKVENVADPPRISYDPKNKNSYTRFVNDIDKRLKPFYAFEAKLSKNFITVSNDACKSATSFINCRKGMQLVQRWRNNTADCSQSNDYGYASGKPCVLLTLNKLIGWVPALKGDTAVKVVCFKKRGEEAGSLIYVPAQGFPSYFFPYDNKAEFISYPIFVKFNSPPSGEVVIECDPEDDQISFPSHSRYNTHGMVVFGLSVSK